MTKSASREPKVEPVSQSSLLKEATMNALVEHFICWYLVLSSSVPGQHLVLFLSRSPSPLCSGHRNKKHPEPLMNGFSTSKTQGGGIKRRARDSPALELEVKRVYAALLA